ncbi:MAG: type IV pilus assembly protein PilM [Planctomycetaceae bacterium]|nr:type IV pilus assembly protein PilM [Planctomycetaceae bacterium]
MARGKAIWGIDIGQSALKALRCRSGETPDQIVADAFDFIEYPKILSQPEANAEELIRDALTQFLSRNSVRGDRVAISVSGQSGLARFIKLPPVESKKIPDIVKYEARQQIPFALEDVVWDYQQMAGGSEEDGFALETEVGLFAMKRDQVNRALAPFKSAGIEVDIVQLAPLALYNYIAFDQMQDLPPPDQFDPENPPPSIVLLSLGTDTTDLVVTNGYRVWQRSIPLGGNHFTKVLTKELKLTFAKAEHLKRNASQAPDPKAVFSAMRQVFNDLLTEVQRSIGYFSGIDRRAKIGKVVVLGNAMKLPGLQRYLGQNLGSDSAKYDVIKLETFRGLVGPGVVDAPSFKENILSFATCYGLALQGLVDTKIHTNLLPAELLRDRLIRAKKPWAVAAAAVLLLGCTVNAFGHWSAWRTARTEAFADVTSPAKAVVSKSQSLESEYGAEKGRFDEMQQIGNNLTQGVEGRLAWLKVTKAINLAIPRDPNALEKPVEEREELHIDTIQCVKAQSLEAWYNGRNAPAPGAEVAEPEEEPAAPPAGEEAAEVEEIEPPSGEGWVFRIQGYHYHNKEGDTAHEGANYVRETLMKNLSQKRLPMPEGEKVPPELQAKPDQTDFPVGDLGVGFPFLIDPPAIVPSTLSVREGFPPNEPNGEDPKVRVFDFVVEFCWQPSKMTAEEEGTEGAEDAEVAAN